MIVKSVEKKENNTATFQVDLDKAEFEAALHKAYLKNKKSISVPGFRKGKAPRMVIEGMFGQDVFYDDAVNELAPEAFNLAVEQEDLKTVGRPSITDVNVSDEKELTLSFETALYPVATLGEYKGLEAPKAAVEVTDADVDAELEKIQTRNARLVTVERPAADGDTAVIDFEGFLDGVPFDGGKGESHSLVLGSGQFIPGFESQVVGMSTGEEKDLDITFPEDYHADLAGKAVVFKVKVNEVKESQSPALDDEFAKDVSEFDTLDEYKADIKENLMKARETAAEEQFKEALMKKAVENMQVEIPDAMIEEQQDLLINDYAQNLAMQGYSLEQYLGMMGMDVNMFRTSARPAALRQIESELLLSAIADAEAIECSPEEIEEEYQKAAESYNVDLETIKKAVEETAIVKDMRLRKASEIIYSTAIATEPVEEVQEDKADTAE